MESKDEVVMSMTHELVHAYDDYHGLANIDKYSSGYYACSEEQIRAYHLCGLCHYKELRRSHPWVVGNVKKKIEGDEQECLKQKAIGLLLQNHSPDEAKSVVEAVWSRCRNNTAPFRKPPPTAYRKYSF